MNFRPLIMPLLLVVGTLFYYFGELVDWATWDALRLKFFYGIHDVHRLLFLAPIIYAGYAGRVRGALIITLVSYGIFLPRAFFISPYPDPLLRMTFFILFAGAIGILTAIIRNKMERCQQLETIVSNEKDKLLHIIEGMTDGLVITAPDYRIRFMNAKMVKDFGDGTGQLCYQHLHHRNAPCVPDCQLQEVINKGEIYHWLCGFPGNRVYEVVAAPFVDADSVTCQLAIFRNASQEKQV